MDNKFRILQKKVIEKSMSKEWFIACKEWYIIEKHVDNDCNTDCICTHKHIRELYGIKNSYTKEVLFPVGSRCIDHFLNLKKDRDDLNRDDNVGHGVYSGLTFKEIREKNFGYAEYLLSLSNPKLKIWQQNYIRYSTLQNEIEPCSNYDDKLIKWGKQFVSFNDFYNWDECNDFKAVEFMMEKNLKGTYAIYIWYHNKKCNFQKTT